jgi:rod shape-determining protein MreD
MRWISFALFAYAFVLVQATLGQILVFDRLGVGPVGPDLVAILAVFLALHVRNRIDALLGAWALGALIDLTMGGGVVGPMAVGYVLGVWLVFALRESIFRERALPQMFLAMVFCFLAHGLWVTAQTLLCETSIGLYGYGAMLQQVFLSAVYTALLMPLGHFLLHFSRGLLLTAAPRRERRKRT